MQHKWIGLLALAALLAAPGRGANPKLTLSLKQVTVAEVCAAVQAASGISITVEPIAEKPLPPRISTQRGDFDWHDTTLSNVLRDLSARFDVSVSHPGEGAFRLTPVGDRVAAPSALDVGVVMQRGVRLSVKEINTHASRGLSLEGDPMGGSEGGTSLTLSCRSETLNRAAFAGLEQLAAKDDMGNLLLMRTAPPDQVSLSSIPDETLLRALLTAPHPLAKKLVWIEGELLLHDTVLPVNADFPLPVAADQRPVIHNGVTLEVLEFTPGPRSYLKGRITYPEGWSFDPGGRRLGKGTYPELVGMSGKVYGANSMGAEGRGDGNQMVWTATWGFPQVQEPVKALRWRLFLRDSQTTLIKFRMTDVPLPPRQPRAAATVPTEFAAPEAPPNALRPLPPLGLKLDKVTADEAAAALTKASGLEFGVFEPNPSPPRESFDWTRSNWTQALRELEARFDLVARQSGAGFRLTRAIPRPAPPVARRPVEFNKPEFRLALQGIQVTESHHRIFVAPTDMKSHASTQVHLGLRTGAIDPAQWAGIANVRAKDDQGRTLHADYNRLIPWMPRFMAPPDELMTVVGLSLPHPAARKLQSLEGDLLIYGDLGAVREALTAPLTESPLKREFDGGSFEVQGKLPFEGGAQRTAHVHLTLDQPDADITTFSLVPVAVSGKRYPPNSTSSQKTAGTKPSWTWNLGFRSLPEPIERLELVARWRAKPQRLMRFRLLDLPLPAETPFRPIQRQPATARDHAPQPLFDAKGGSLKFKIRLGDNPAPSGVLSVGLAPKDGAVRWFEVNVSKEGLASAEAIRPGSYRLLQAYQPDLAPDTPGLGRWLNAETKVTIAPGKATQVPELRWTAR